MNKRADSFFGLLLFLFVLFLLFSTCSHFASSPNNVYDSYMRDCRSLHREEYQDLSECVSILEEKSYACYKTNQTALTTYCLERYEQMVNTQV